MSSSAVVSPICVACDGAVVRTNLLLEGAMQLLKRSLSNGFRLLFWSMGGKAILKEKVALNTELDYAHLPYNQEFVAFLRQQKELGRQVVLVTGAHEVMARGVAAHLGVFSAVYATGDGTNLDALAKQQLLCRLFGSHGYVYAGSSLRDAVVWASAGKAIVINSSERVRRFVAQQCEVEWFSAGSRSNLSSAFRALRPHQWLKNLLVLIPIFASHRLEERDLLVRSLVAVGCFCLCASSAYVTNDLFDLAADRRHPRKMGRPFAAGQLTISAGCALAVLLVGAAAIGSAFLSDWFRVTLLTYYVLTLGYSIDLKNRPVVDVLVLSSLYTIRMLGGGAATHIRLSFWLLAFSVFLFLSLALVKRYAELLMILSSGKDKLRGRGYTVNDLGLVASLGQSSGLIAVLVLALYVNSPEVTLLYRSPVLLWLLVPPMLYWICRMWLKAHRGQMFDDPLVFAATDGPSLVAGAVMVLTAVIAAIVVV